MIELQSVTKVYRTQGESHVVLDHLSFVFPDYARVGVLGYNGAGKSTLLRILAGAEEPNSGRVITTGRISWPVGFGGGLNGSLSGEENCRFVARIHGADLDAVTEYARDFAEIGKHFYMPVRTYSSGMRGRLAFGLSMALDFDTYLVDEVTAVGDKTFREKAKREFEARRDRSSLIIVSHQLNSIRQHCDVFCVLSKGRLYAYERLRDAKKAYEAA